MARECRHQSSESSGMDFLPLYSPPFFSLSPFNLFFTLARMVSMNKIMRAIFLMNCGEKKRQDYFYNLRIYFFIKKLELYIKSQ